MENFVQWAKWNLCKLKLGKFAQNHLKHELVVQDILFFESGTRWPPKVKVAYWIGKTLTEVV